MAINTGEFGATTTGSPTNEMQMTQPEVLTDNAILLRAGYFPDAGFFTQRTGMPERQSMSIMFTWLLFEKSRYW